LAETPLWRRANGKKRGFRRRTGGTAQGGNKAVKCVYCGHTETEVLESRDSEDLEAVRRRRECEKCNKRFTTYERPESPDLFVLKKDGRREKFDSHKLKGGIVKACEKRPVPIEEIDRIVDEVERELRKRENAEVKSTEIGELVMRKLKKVDKVAYIRFASVYKDFEDLEEFETALHELLKKK